MAEESAAPRRRRSRLVEVRSTVNLAGFRAGTYRFVDVSDTYIEGLINSQVLVPRGLELAPSRARMTGDVTG